MSAFMCVFHLYLLLIVSPRILSEVTVGICILLQVIVQVQLRFCRCVGVVTLLGKGML